MFGWFKFYKNGAMLYRQVPQEVFLRVFMLIKFITDKS